MKNKINYEIKAFPYEESYNHTGMDLRDYFAARAMQAMIGNNTFLSALSKDNRSMELAEHAFSMADAMIEARKVKND